MSVLFVGKSKEMYQAVRSHQRTDRRLEVDLLGYGEFDSLQSPAQAEHSLIILGVSDQEDADSVDRILMSDRVDRPTPMVVIASKPSGEQLLRWMQAGIAAVELWPCHSSRLAFLLDSLTVNRRMHRSIMQRRPMPSPDCVVDDSIVLESRAMKHLVQQLQRVAPLSANVLLGGETGVGKTTLARLLHDNSSRFKAPFVTVNCGALPESLLESELFGHRRGAFTGADTNRKGRFEEVGSGTLFLDEIDSIPLGSQCKLLRAIENRVFEPLGSSKSVQFRGRIVAASNSPLDRLIERGLFRADLYYRLGVIDFYVPPLRERREDIEHIATRVVRELARETNSPVKTISPLVIDRLQAYHWPGNVRQLRNVVHCSASLCVGDQIEMSDLSGRWLRDVSLPPQKIDDARANDRVTSAPPDLTESSDSATLAQMREKSELAQIRRVLKDVDNNRTRAAIQLGISRTMLYRKIAKYGIAEVG
ncbi:MAG: sigma-54-dependent Fis family transcriptional regulator [Pirellulaceae bacterium]|nr:sigma-54-dependent Fis family transcriptional regulator [Pirellulaceae bacterium]